MPLDLRLVVILAAFSLCVTLRWAGISLDLLVESAFLTGIVLGMRSHAFILLWTCTALVLITVVIDLASENNGADAIALNVLAVHVTHQIGYLFGAASCPYMLTARESILMLLRRSWTKTARIRAELTGRDGGKPRRDNEPTTSPISLTPTGDLLNAIESLARAVSADAILGIIRSSARRLIGSDGVALILAEGELCHYVEEDAVGPLWKGRKFKMTECISGWSMINGRTAVIDDISTDERIPHHLYADTFVKSLVMTPVGVERPIGALGAYWASPYQPTDYEIETVKILARSTATALENAKRVSMLSHSLAQAELKQDELRHRAENAYLAAQSLAHVSLAPASAEVFAARIATLAGMHEAVDRKLALQRGIDIRELIQSELEAFGGVRLGPVNIEGFSLLLDRAQAIALGVAVNELAINALKDGARGRLNVSWRSDRNGLFFEWRQQRKGKVGTRASGERSGWRLLHRLIEDQLGGTVRHGIKDNDVICEIEFPLQEISSPPSAEVSAASALART